MIWIGDLNLSIINAGSCVSGTRTCLWSIRTPYSLPDRLEDDSEPLLVVECGLRTDSDLGYPQYSGAF